MKTLISTLFAATVLCLPASAGIIINLDQPVQTGGPGQTLFFTGSVYNDGLTEIFLNSNDFGFELSGADYTLNDHFLSLPLSLQPDESTGSMPLFDITLSEPLVDIPGLYGGTWTILGGGTDQDMNNLYTANFSVNVVSPEPGTILLVLGGLAAVSHFRRKLRYYTAHS